MFKKTAIIIIILTFLSSTMFPLITKGENNTTIVQLDPSTITITEIGEIFSLNVTIVNVTGLCAWDFKLYYRNSILSCLDATEGPFLETGGDTWWAENITDSYNSTHGRARFGCSLLGQVPGVNGSGVLANITFQAKGGGDTLLHFDDTRLYDCGTPPHLIEHEAIDGEVYGKIHDVAVINVVSSKAGCPGVGDGVPYPVLCQGRTAEVNVTAENQGNNTESFDVTVYANDSIIQTFTVTNLDPSNQETRTVIWNATGWAKGNYTIKAVADQVTGEIDLGDNTFIDKWVVVVHPGDLDNSGEVDITDVVMVTGIYRAKIGDPEYNACRDVVEDGEIDISDVVAVTGHYREKDP